MHNARLAERAPFSGQVDIVPTVGDRALREWAQDVSETGMFVHTRQPFRVGDSVSLRFDHADAEVHIRAAEVVWVRRPGAVVDGQAPGIGVRFVSVDPAMRTALRRLASPTRSQPPSSSLPPSLAKQRHVENTDDLLRPAPGGAPLAHAFATSGVPGPLSISLPPDDPSLSSEARVFARVPAGPRAVTIGPRPRSTPPSSTSNAATNTTTAPVAQPTTPPTDPFAGWTFRRADEPAAFDVDVADDADDTNETPDALRVRFDDDAPRALPPRPNPSVIDNPSILQSTTIPPVPGDEGFALGALPASTERAFIDGALSIRHLPLATDRRAAPGVAPARVSLGAAAAFLVAGCCAGAVVGLLQRDPTPVVAPPAIAAALAPIDAPPPVPAVVDRAAAPASASSPAVADVAAAPTPAPTVVDVATAEQALPPAAVADAAIADAAASADPTTDAPATSSKAAAKEPTSTAKEPAKATTKAKASPAGRLEVKVPRGGRVQKAFALASPARVVVDVKGAALPERLPGVAGAREVRVGRPEKGVERVVIVLDGDDKPEVAKAKIAGGRLVVRWRR